MSKGKGLLSSTPGPLPRLRDGPARPEEYSWPRSHRGPAPARSEDGQTTDRCTCGKTLLHARSASTAILAGIGGVYQHHSLAGPCCLAGEDGAESTPASVRNECAEAPVPYQVGDPQVFEIEGVVGLDQRQGRLVVKVSPL